MKTKTMQKRIKIYIALLILISVLIASSFVLAAWWNPFSWGIWNNIFHKQTPTVQQTNQTAKWQTEKQKTDWYGVWENNSTDINISNVTDSSFIFGMNPGSSGMTAQWATASAVNTNTARGVVNFGPYMYHNDESPVQCGIEFKIIDSSLSVKITCPPMKISCPSGHKCNSDFSIIEGAYQKEYAVAADWTNYSATAIPVSFHIPPNYDVEEGEKPIIINKNSINLPEITLNPMASDNVDSITIHPCVSMETENTIDDVINISKESPDPNVYVGEKMIISGLPALHYLDPSINYYEQIYYVQDKGNLYCIIFQAQSDYTSNTSNAATQQIDDRFIKSIKFTDAASSNTTAVQTTAQDLTITTDKTSYTMGEKINITVKNPNDAPMWCGGDECGCSNNPGVELESYENGSWGDAGISALRYCHMGPCTGCLQISSNNEIGMDMPYTLVPGYNYRLKLETAATRGQFSECDPATSKEIYSNSFSIKEQPELIKEFTGTFTEDQYNNVGLQTDSGVAYEVVGERKTVAELVNYKGRRATLMGYLLDGVLGTGASTGYFNNKEYSQSIFAVGIK